VSNFHWEYLRFRFWSTTMFFLYGAIQFHIIYTSATWVCFKYDFLDFTAFLVPVASLNINCLFGLLLNKLLWLIWNDCQKQQSKVPHCKNTIKCMLRSSENNVIFWIFATFRKETSPNPGMIASGEFWSCILQHSKSHENVCFSLVWCVCMHKSWQHLHGLAWPASILKPALKHN